MHFEIHVTTQKSGICVTLAEKLMHGEDKIHENHTARSKTCVCTQKPATQNTKGWSPPRAL